MSYRLETTTLKEMRAKQGAVVSKFLTFFQRKSTLVIELYSKCFYNSKPLWNRIADFIADSLCYRPELKEKIMDVQFHPVKMTNSGMKWLRRLIQKKELNGCTMG